MNKTQQHFDYLKFESLYYGSTKDAKYCLANNVSQEYMCPSVGPGGIKEMPLNSWFAKQNLRSNRPNCHGPGMPLGKHNLKVVNRPTTTNKQQTGGYQVNNSEVRNPIMAYNISYYHDLSLKTIGKRPVLASHNQQPQFNRDIGCRQPRWNSNCI